MPVASELEPVHYL